MTIEDAITISRIQADLLARDLDRGDLDKVEKGAAALSLVACQLRNLAYYIRTSQAVVTTPSLT